MCIDLIIHIITTDFENLKEIEKVKEEVECVCGDSGLNLLINNAGSVMVNVSVTRPQFKTCLYARLTFNHAASTLQDAAGFSSTHRFKVLILF